MHGFVKVIFLIEMLCGCINCSLKRDDKVASDALSNYENAIHENNENENVDGLQYADDKQSDMQILQNKLNSTSAMSEGQIDDEASVSASSTKRCLSGWYYFGGSCYRIVTWCMRDYWSAGKYCKGLSYGARLVSVNYFQEFDFLVSQLKKRYSNNSPYFWTSGTRNNHGIWYWNNGVRKESFTTGGLWLPGEPNNSYGSEDCINLRTISGRYGLNDAPGTHLSYFICEKPL